VNGTIQLGLDAVEQVTIENGGLLALEGLAFEDNLTNLKAVATGTKPNLALVTVRGTVDGPDLRRC
jgi:hypothetical protein